MSMLEFEAYHPVVEVLVSRFEVDAAGLENLHEQLLAYRRDLKKLKELLLKYKLTNELVYQQALAEYYDLEFQDCLLYTSPSPRDRPLSRMPTSA